MTDTLLSIWNGLPPFVWGVLITLYVLLVVFVILIIINNLRRDFGFRHISEIVLTPKGIKLFTFKYKQ